MAQNEKIPSLRIPESNWWTLRDQFIKTVPKEVNLTYLKSLLGVSDGAASNLISPLKQTGLIDNEGRPTPLAYEWRSNEKYPDVCRKILELYPQGLRDLYNEPDSDKDNVQQWFMDSAQLGKGSAKLSASFYLLLLDATPKSSADYNKPKKKATDKIIDKKPPNTKKSDDTKKSPDTKEPSDKSSSTTDKIIDETPKLESPQKPAPTSVISRNESELFSLHIDLQIHISPDATPSQIDQIFESMARHVISMKSVNKRNHENTEDNNNPS